MTAEESAVLLSFLTGGVLVGVVLGFFDVAVGSIRRNGK